MESSHSGSIQPLAPLPRTGMRPKFQVWVVAGLLQTRPHPKAIHELITCPLLRTEDVPVTPEMPGRCRSAVSGTQQGVGRDQVHTAFDITGHVRRVLQAI